MLVSPTAFISCLLPLSTAPPASCQPRYKAVMFSGGLRGAIALVTGAVLFTHLVQGLTVERLVTPTSLYELRRADVEALRGTRSAIHDALTPTARLRSGLNIWGDRDSSPADSQSSTK